MNTVFVFPPPETPLFNKDQCQWRLHQQTSGLSPIASHYSDLHLPSQTMPDKVILVLPAEHVITLAVTLPNAARSELSKALPFILEDYFCTPIEERFIVSLDAVAPGQHAVACIEHNLMQYYCDWLDDNFPTARNQIVIDGWLLTQEEVSVYDYGNRCLICTADWQVQVCHPDNYPFIIKAIAAQTLEDQSLENSHDIGPTHLQSGQHVWEHMQAGAIKHMPNLRQGRYSSQHNAHHNPISLLLLGVLFSALIVFGGKSYKLQVTGDEIQSLTDKNELIFRELFPNARIIVDVRAQLKQKLATLNTDTQKRPLMQANFLPILGHISRTLNRTNNPVSVRQIKYQQSEKDVFVDVEAPHIEQLNTFKSSLNNLNYTAKLISAKNIETGFRGYIRVSPHDI